MTRPPSNVLEELRIKRPIRDSQKEQSEVLFQKHKNQINGLPKQSQSLPQLNDTDKETVFKTQGAGPTLECVSLSTDFDTKIEIVDGKKISRTVKVETPVKIFRTINECKESASLEQQYAFAEERITNPLTKLFNAISGNDEEIIKLNSDIIKQTKSRESSLEHDDFESSEIYTRSIARLILKRRQLEEKKAAKSVLHAEEISFMMENIYNPLKRVHPPDTIDFCEHLLAINPDSKIWTSQFVAQEYANFFNVTIPGYEIGGVSGLSSAFVKKILYESKLSPCITDEIMQEIMSSLGVSKTTVEHKKEVSIGNPNQGNDEITQLTKVQVTLPSDHDTQIPNSLADYQHPRKFHKMRTLSLPNLNNLGGIDNMHDITKLNILNSGLKSVLDSLETVPLSSIPNEQLDRLLTVIDETNLQKHEIENHTHVKNDKATTVWGRAMDILISGSSAMIAVGTLLASTSGFSASTAEAAGASGLSQSILVAPVTSAVTAISAAGASAIPVTEALAATATTGGFSALTSTISALAATPATAPMAASAFSSVSGLSVAAFPVVAALVGAGAVLFALNKAKGRYLASLPDSSGEKHLALLTVEEDDKTIRLDPIPQSFSQEMDDSISFMKDVQFLSENPESVSYREKVDLLHPKAEIVKKLSLDSFVPDEKVFSDLDSENESPIPFGKVDIKTISIGNNDDEIIPSSAIVEETTLPTDFPLQNDDPVNITKPTIVDTITSVESQNPSSQHQELTPPQQSSEDSTQILQPYHNHLQLRLRPQQQLIQHPSQPQQYLLQSPQPEPGVSVYDTRVVGLIVKNNKRGIGNMSVEYLQR
ncbi:hypothetical protein BDK51DRAFT_46524 [Blyttiomyces helicus]|uniref:Uncharacterized protein n=1 Tax=Blyttiomyces helicus TaxID=388810 RepID=A0A4V1IPW2_9FUNG|nr:hypothetical protein BDK51DRAFT_46524 [Blyttiomyces helicus]|eukprot:RKO84447.1 hypothetical protein BDK51DRAFT_46524 [Blyttiomyces helicus]